MAVVQTLIGNIKGPQGETGATGAQGIAGDAATIAVGTVTTTDYGTAATVTNSGTSSAAVFDFSIPQGKPGEATTKMGDLSLDAITTSTASFPSPQVGDTGKTAFGKIVKFFADTVAALAAKIDISKIADNLTTNDASYVLSAKQGKALNDSLTTGSSITLINTSDNIVRYWKNGVVCTVQIEKATATSTSWLDICQLPTNARPNNFIINNDDSTLQINASGYVRARVAGSHTGYFTYAI